MFGARVFQKRVRLILASGDLFVCGAELCYNVRGSSFSKKGETHSGKRLFVRLPSAASLRLTRSARSSSSHLAKQIRLCRILNVDIYLPFTLLQTYSTSENPTADKLMRGEALPI